MMQNESLMRFLTVGCAFPVGSGEWNMRFGVWMVAIQAKISDRIVTGI
jgi:hypothetical protein